MPRTLEIDYLPDEVEASLSEDDIMIGYVDDVDSENSDHDMQEQLAELHYLDLSIGTKIHNIIRYFHHGTKSREKP